MASQIFSLIDHFFIFIIYIKLSLGKDERGLEITSVSTLVCASNQSMSTPPHPTPPPKKKK